MAKIIKRPWHLYQPRFLPYDWIPPIPRPLTVEEVESYHDYFEFGDWWEEIVQPILQEALLNLPMSLRLRAVGVAFRMVEDVWSVIPAEEATSEWNELRQWWFSVNRFIQQLSNVTPLPVPGNIPVPTLENLPAPPIVTGVQRHALVAAVLIMFYLEYSSTDSPLITYLTSPVQWLAFADGSYDLDVMGEARQDMEVREYDLLIREWRFYNEWAGKVQGLLAFRIPESD